MTIQPDNAGKDIPPENGKRASYNSATGAVHGSGVGTGGGSEGEDFDNDSVAGDGPVPSAKGPVARPAPPATS